ncbi:hypothetical protein A3F29_00255 [Candidatus Roizmanbacteria bacterium RIFCSPHIGHO2_12_FULL_33_9]|uniref:Glycosyltransferase subfamily 4-like N-terminal domain-containing protein n=1 Tax=Candidatus Roizmanbacteria bacterium RIFCSPHIGHO2_12_FULL_33_9 TaxID=1802045 RepID=A0A1F7HJ85_9BACT|nr:MAG: hypothetical protein A3F29_00255 [Candidatus Roizmanbacteria bacterium RIFCSPHIGHO2_12_FULL_33_9]
MKILMVSSYLPYPLYSGGHIRLYNILKKLSEKHDVTLICEKRPHQTEENIKKVEKICKKLITVPRKKQWTLSNILLSGASPNSFLVTGHTLAPMRENIEDLLTKEKFDLIHAETFYIAQNIPRNSVSLVIAEHNIEYLVYGRFAQKAPFYLKPFLYADIFKLKKNEERVWEKADFVIAVSRGDKTIIDKFNEKVYIVPNGVDLTKFKIQSSELRINNKKERIILFMGDFKWVQNRDALKFILEKIWPPLNLKFKISNLKLKLWVVGKNIPDNFKDTRSDLVFDENAPDDTSLIFQKSDILLAPIRVGGGTSYKILEAMASGVPVITTSLGAEGLGAENNKELLIAENKDDFIAGIQELISNESFYKKISENGRKLIENKYDWKIIVKKLEQVYKLAVDSYY